MPPAICDCEILLAPTSWLDLLLPPDKNMVNKLMIEQMFMD